MTPNVITGGDSVNLDRVGVLTFRIMRTIVRGMNLKRILTQDNIRIGLPGTNKQEIIESLIDLLAGSSTIRNRDEVLQAVMKRESQMSTGMKHGIAIPHGKTDAVKDLAACFAISENDIDFDSMDGKPCRIFVMTVSPVTYTGPHLEFLAEVSDLLKREDLRQKALTAASSEELYNVLFSRT
jgi:PTS system nitrogen regulatory IIA component